VETGVWILGCDEWTPSAAGAPCGTRKICATGNPHLIGGSPWCNGNPRTCETP
jgi:hypothetical protein